jgi:hypothetical protein
MATQALPAELGTRATDFALKDVHGQLTRLADVSGEKVGFAALWVGHGEPGAS